MLIDLHTHSNMSDGTDTPTELVWAASRVVDVVALTDHDTFDGLPEAKAAARTAGIGLVPGIEISTGIGGKTVHLLGYLCDPKHLELATELQRIRDGRNERLPMMVAALQRLGFDLNVTDLLNENVGVPVLGRPHVADALVRRGLVANRREAFERFLAEGKEAYVPRYVCELESAIALVLAAGGVPVLAHPWGREPAHLLTPAKLATLVREHGLAGLEVDHQDHDAPTRARLRALANELGVIITGSSDYHGCGKVNHEIGCNTTAPEMFERLVAARSAS